MPVVNFITQDGSQKSITSSNGENIKDIALDNDIEGIYGECGGSCTCATCHVYVDAAWFNKIEPSDEFEQDMLEFAPDVTLQSRLSCQIKMSDALDGIKIIVPNRQY